MTGFTLFSHCGRPPPLQQKQRGEEKEEDKKKKRERKRDSKSKTCGPVGFAVASPTFPWLSSRALCRAANTQINRHEDGPDRPPY